MVLKEREWKRKRGERKSNGEGEEMERWKGRGGEKGEVEGGGGEEGETTDFSTKFILSSTRVEFAKYLLSSWYPFANEPHITNDATRHSCVYTQST